MQSRPTVLMVGNFLSGAPTSRGVCEDLCEHLRAAGWGVLATSHLRGRPQRLLDMVTATWRHRRRYQVALVDVFSGPSFRWAEMVGALLWRLRRPFVLTLRGGNLPEFARQNGERVRRLLGRAAAVTAPSGYLLERMRPYREDLRLLVNPIDASRYPCRIRSEVAPRLVWLRAFHEVYNPMLAVRVLSLLLPDCPQATLTMVGPDKDDGSAHRVQEAVRSLGLGDRVRLPGGVPKAEVPVWLDRGDIFLNTTSIDNTPVSVLEAMACGLCTVSTEVGGIPYLLQSERDALLVPPNDADAMAGAVRRVLADARLAERLSAHGHQKALGHDWKVVLPQWEELLSRLASLAWRGTDGEGRARDDADSCPL